MTIFKKLNKNLILYGCQSEQEFDFIQAERQSFNHKVWSIISFLSFFYFCILFLTSFSLDAVQMNTIIYGSMIAVTAFVVVLLRNVARPGSRWLMPVIYFMAFGYLFFGIYVGVVTSREYLAATYHVLMLGIILITADKPYRMTILEFISTAIFIGLCWYLKTGETRSLDIYNAIVFYVIAQCVNYYMVYNRMTQFLLGKKLEIASQTDELTQINNRNGYEADMLAYVNQFPAENCVYVSIDVNGLKVINDSLGHAAGDELLKGAAKCIVQCLAQYGKVYRVGGDEFVAILHVTEEEQNRILGDLSETVNAWKGIYIDSISLAVGAAAKRELSNLTMEDLSKLADARMYEDKKKYYRYKGVDRRGQQAAFDALCFSCTKILQVNLTKDSYHLIQISEEEAIPAQVLTLSDWLLEFGNSNMVHENDRINFLEKTSLEYLRNYFRNGKNSIHIFYKRKQNDIYRQSMIEMIVKNDYTDDNQELFLYVKDIDV